MEEKTRECSLNSKECVVRDINKYLDQFPNRNYAMRCLANSSKLNSKTIKRITEGKTTPSYQTIFKIYSVILKTDNEKKIMEQVPQSVLEVLKKASSFQLKEEINNKIDLYKVIQEHPLASELIVLAGIQNLSLNTIAYRYGQYGVELSEMLLDESIFVEVKSREYQLNPQLPRLDGKVIKKIGLHLTKRFSDAEITIEEKQNILSLYAENLNQEGIEQWLAIDTKAFHDKVQIAHQDKYKGHIPYFTFTASDQLMKRE